MAYCKKCGELISDTTAFCPKCGAAQNSSAPAVVDNGGFGWGVLGCCIPLVGLILFLVWKDTKPKTAKAAGIGALVSVIVTAVFYFIGIVAGAAAGMM